MDEKNHIKSFRDLKVYQRTYEAMKISMTQIVPFLPLSEKYDLKDQLSRSSKSVPRLIAEGYAKRHQKAGFQKYLDDAMGECNETVVSLEQCRDLYPSHIDLTICDELIANYEVASRQLYKLAMKWSAFKKRKDFET